MIYVLSGEMFVTNGTLGRALRRRRHGRLARGWTAATPPRSKRFPSSSARRPFSRGTGALARQRQAAADRGRQLEVQPRHASLPALCRAPDGVAPYLDKCDVCVCPSIYTALVKDNFTPGIRSSAKRNFRACRSLHGWTRSKTWASRGCSSATANGGEFGLPPPAESTSSCDEAPVYFGPGLNCVFCIGEPLSIRQKGIQAVLAECADRLRT